MFQSITRFFSAASEKPLMSVLAGNAADICKQAQPLPVHLGKHTLHVPLKSAVTHLPELLRLRSLKDAGPSAAALAAAAAALTDTGAPASVTSTPGWAAAATGFVGAIATGPNSLMILA